jgi:predicted helicase
MNALSLKPTHKSILSYYSQLRKFEDLNATNEGSLAPLFAELLKHCGRQFEYTLIEQYSMKRNGKTIRADGALIDKYNLIHGIWEAKDSTDDLEKEVKKKFEAGYPSENILFQAPEHIIIFQNGREAFNEKIINPQFLIRALKIFFEEYQPKEFLEWEKAAEDFKDRVPEIGRRLLKQIETERKDNKRFISAFNDFYDLCRQTINPELSVNAVEEMLIQHILTERIFRNVFKNVDFVNRNIIAREIEKVISALTSQYFSRDEFLRDLDRFYMAIETTANTLVDYSEKQHFLNTIYEKFFQGFSIKVADTHGIVYTPQPIVDFMVRSVEDILKKEFNKSLSDEGVHILDPFVGTGNFIIRVMHEMQRHKLLFKYSSELHCNEVMLLPYYIASMNIEHAYFDLTRSYLPFEGICLVDTFELAEAQQISNLDVLFSKENTARVKKQKEAPIFVIIGNPPYNAGQVNENDKNKNRKYKVMDERVKDTYIKDSKATLVTQLSDPYVKAIRWASDRVGKEGIVAFITNNSFLDGIAFDGMRKHLEMDFSTIYHINLKGNARTSGERRRQEAGNVFNDQIRVSVGISFFIKKPSRKFPLKLFIYNVEDYLKSEQKNNILIEAKSIQDIPLLLVKPNENNIWLTQGMQDKFESFLPLGLKNEKVLESIFHIYSNGVKTNEDSYVYNFQKELLRNQVLLMIENYSYEFYRWTKAGCPKIIEDFIAVNESKLKWIRNTKRTLLRGIELKFDDDKFRKTLYRPYCKTNYYFERAFSEDTYSNSRIFPSKKQENENRLICLTAIGNNKPFQCIMSNIIPDLHLTGDSQCFPFYIYSEDGSNHKENITDWSLKEFRSHYKNQMISKWDIFYYIYPILHHSEYRTKYAANLRRSFPRIPYAPDFKSFAKAGEKLADLHMNYEAQPEYKLEFIENKKAELSWRVEKMRLSKDKTSLVYNDFLTLSGIPAKTFEYRLGNRSALDWIIDQYQVSTDKRSGIVNDPNNPDDPEYIVKLIGKVINVSIQTVDIINDLPKL